MSTDHNEIMTDRMMCDKETCVARCCLRVDIDIMLFESKAGADADIFDTQTGDMHACMGGWVEGCFVL